ncbi:hypothetical protein QUA13_24265 [Microcoleus sp. S28C3]|uniref:hypothetical protein n=1 Tax=Microcoleus sp. S28C3 TaxID=3055414 RepID=UPI002FCFE389
MVRLCEYDRHMGFRFLSNGIVGWRSGRALLAWYLRLLARSRAQSIVLFQSPPVDRSHI